jgi:hypothetical protein
MPDERDDALAGPVNQPVDQPDEQTEDQRVDQPLRNGRYDAFILSAETRDDGVAISCTITAGPHRGDVIDLVSQQFATRDPFDLVGMPCTLVVAADTIRIEP